MRLRCQVTGPFVFAKLKYTTADLVLQTLHNVSHSCVCLMSMNQVQLEKMKSVLSVYAAS